MEQFEETPLFDYSVDYDSLPTQKTHLDDGISKVDFILLYRNEDNQSSEENSKREKRQSFCKNLEKHGLVLEPRITEEDGRTQYGITFDQIVFVKVHAPFKVLHKIAMKTKMKFPVMKNNFKEENETQLQSLFKQFTDFKIVSPYIPEGSEDENYYVDLMENPHDPDKFIHTKNEHDFFTSSERQLLVHHILKSTRFGKGRYDLGIDSILQQEIFKDIYPIHDGPLLHKTTTKHQKKMNLRQKLQVHWASYKKIFKYQPINSIKRYFGEKVAIYFAWLGMYTTFLFPVAIFGLICFVYGIYVATNDVIVHEVCSAGTNVNTSIILCPLCHRMCDYQFLQRKCFYTKLSRFFDNGSAIVFAIFVSVWATVFLEFWKRKQISLAYQWHTLEYEDDEELPRPKFNIRAKKYTRKSPVTNELEHYMPKIQTRVRLSVSISIVFILCCILVICYFFIGNLGSYAFKKLSESSNETIKYNASIIKVVITGFLNLIVILAFQSQYPTAAKRLTEWENPKTETDFEDSYITKMFWFNFVNNFCPLIFIAFVERNYLPWKDYGLIKPERCSMQGCFVDLSIQLIIIMIGKQFIGNIQEILIPYLKTKWQKRANAVQYNISDHTLKPQWILDYNCLPHGQHALLNQYLEIVLQFCYVTMFVAAFPLAPLFALINNLIEIRLDATSHIRLFRRPIPRKVQDIGAWFDILNVISKISILVSGFLIAFTSEWIPRTVYKYRYSPNGSYKGYTEFSLSYFNIKDFTDDEKPIASSISQTFCRYPGYYKDKEPYSETLDYWIIFGARFAFIVSFQVLGLSISSIIAYMVPDVPEELKIMKKKEKFLEQQRREDTSGTIFNS